MALARMPDSELEELRNEVEPEEDVGLIATELQTLTAQVHAAFLFENEGLQTLQNLCLYIGAASVNKVYSNWCTFANHLGLTHEKMKCIENYFQQKQDPVFWTLGAYAQQTDATIAKVINSLWKINRKDVISVINHDVRNLIEHLSDRINSEGILRPFRKPEVPLVLCSLEEVRMAIDTSINLNHIGTNGIKIVHNPKRRVAYAARVLLTFANDGRKTAYRIAEKFRSHEPKIGVLILEEQSSQVFREGTKFINFILKKVDNIIPILSKEYFDKINDLSTVKDSQSSFASDDKYVEYIYQSLEQEFFNDGCKSHRVRCILPNGMTPRDIPNGNVALRTWSLETEISDFIKHLLREKKEKLKAKKMMECNES